MHMIKLYIYKYVEQSALAHQSPFFARVRVRVCVFPNSSTLRQCGVFFLRVGVFIYSPELLLVVCGTAHKRDRSQWCAIVHIFALDSDM